MDSEPLEMTRLYQRVRGSLRHETPFRIRFNLRTAFVAMTACAVVCALARSQSSGLKFLAALFISLLVIESAVAAVAVVLQSRAVFYGGTTPVLCLIVPIANPACGWSLTEWIEQLLMMLGGAAAGGIATAVLVVCVFAWRRSR